MTRHGGVRQTSRAGLSRRRTDYPTTPDTRRREGVHDREDNVVAVSWKMDLVWDRTCLYTPRPGRGPGEGRNSLDVLLFP